MNENHPSHWGSLEEYYNTPEFQEQKSKEFLQAPQEHSITEMDRRSFLKVMGAGLLFATAGCYRRPVEKIIPYVNRPEEVVPGVADWYATTCGECSMACGVLAKTREGRPIKLEGNDLHPLNRGSLCARGQASVLGLYDPDRLKGPGLVQSGAVNGKKWQEIDEKIRTKLLEIKQSGQSVTLLSAAINSPSTLALIQDFLKNFPEGAHVSFDPLVPEEIGIAQELVYGENLTPHYRFDRAQYILSFGADFLGTWLSPVEFAKDFSELRKVDTGKMSRFVAVESTLSMTGQNADEYVQVKPGDELSIALALANEIILKNRNSRYSGDGSLREALENYSVEKVAAQTGVKAEVLQRLAKELWEKRGKGLVVGGALRAKHAVALQVAVSILNSALENDGVTVDYATPFNPGKSSFLALLGLIDSMKAGKVGALLISESNPLYNLPSSLGFAEALKKVPLVISFSDRLDETAQASHYVCPVSHSLESWNDASPVEGVFSLVQPTIAPLYQTRSMQDSLIQWAGIESKGWYDYLKTYWQQRVSPSYGNGKSFNAFWEKALQEGVVDGSKSRRESTSSARSARTSALKDLLQGVSEEKGEIFLSFYPSLAQADGRSANNAWLQELPDPVSKATWENYLSISPELAKKLSLEQDDVVAVKGEGFSFEAPVHVQLKLSPKTVMIAVGYGRRKAGRVGNELGVNVFPFQKTESYNSGQEAGKTLTWSAGAVSLGKTGKKSKIAITQGHNTLEGRDIVREATFAQFVKGEGEKKAEAHHGAEGSEQLPTMWPVYEYKTYRWGMAIDLNSCTGCNACVIGCQAENNIPVVGKQQVINGREMHWIRIDRYYSGNLENPDVSNQPMLCQHCENAPCETVCPVIATVHDDEGLNQMIYNRCVGTRYCANNCPYKVRRFNFFEYSRQYVDPVNLVLNPDVTTRSRGVMEKCTLCIQRIRGAKDKAKAENRRVAANEIKTACQQTCPTDAITFGDSNNHESELSHLRENKRAYTVLEELNVKSQITYLKKIRNQSVEG